MVIVLAEYFLTREGQRSFERWMWELYHALKSVNVEGFYHLRRLYLSSYTRSLYPSRAAMSNYCLLLNFEDLECWQLWSDSSDSKAHSSLLSQLNKHFTKEPNYEVFYTEPKFWAASDILIGC